MALLGFVYFLCIVTLANASSFDNYTTVAIVRFDYKQSVERAQSIKNDDETEPKTESEGAKGDAVGLEKKNAIVFIWYKCFKNGKHPKNVYASHINKCKRMNTCDIEENCHFNALSGDLFYNRTFDSEC